MLCELHLISALQRQHKWWTGCIGLVQKGTGDPAANWGTGLEAGQLWRVRPRPGPHLWKTTGRRKTKPNSPQPAAARKTSRTCLAGFKPGGSFFSLSFSFLSFFFFSPTSETIRPGVVKGPESDPKRDHHSNWETETNFTLLFQRTCKLLFNCIIIIFQSFTSFILLVFYLFLFFLFHFLHLVCLITLFEWFSSFSLSQCIYSYPSCTSLVF